MAASAFVWSLGRVAAWLFYRVDRVGPPLPDGPLLLVANHPNGLLDPVLIVATSPRVPRFLSKSTLFTMPVIGWFVRSAGAIPVYRRQDAGADTVRNREMFAAVERALGEGACVCLFPEGTTHSSGFLAPLKSGAARIVLGAEHLGIRVAVVPIGLILSRKDVMRSSVTVAYGQAFFADDLARGAADRVDALTDLMATRLRDVMIEASPIGEEELVRRVDRFYAAAHDLPNDVASKIERRRAIARGLSTLRARDAARFDEILEDVTRYGRRMNRFGLRDDTIGGEIPRAAVVRFGVRESAIAVVLGPVILAGALAFAVPYLLIDVLTRRLTNDLEVVATYKVFGGLLVHPLWIAGVSLAVGANTAPWLGWVTAAALPALALAALFGWERERSVLSMVRSYLTWQTLSPRAARALTRQRESLARLIDETHAWLRDDSAAPPVA